MNYTARLLTLVLLLVSLFLGMWIGRVIPSARPWTLEHLRLLDDSFAPQPASDISAVFARPAGTRCEIRLDFLDLPDPPQYEFALTLGGRKTVFSSTSLPPSDARLTADTVTDILALTLTDCRPQADTPLFIETPAERLQTTFGARIEMEPRPLQFVFTNTFNPSATPLQAWRRWDGAHTGPRGERHGLRGLLQAAEKHQVALTLYDTNAPLVLSALDAVNGTPHIRRMEQAGLLALPAGSPPNAPFLHFELNRSGLPLEARQTLLQSASLRLRCSDSSAIPSTSPLLIGGDLQRSTWGTYEYAEPSFAWLKARPYFLTNFMDSTGLPVESTGKPIDSTATGKPIDSTATGELIDSTATGEPIDSTATGKPIDSTATGEPIDSTATGEPIDSTATGKPIDSTATGEPIDSTATGLPIDPIVSDLALAQNYAWIAPMLEQAALWAQNPAPLAACRDLCVLASDTFYAVFNPRGGRLVFFFAGSEQVIGPTAQFFIGLSDRSQWDLSKGEAADPAQIMGAFADADDAFRPYLPEITENAIRFVAAEGREKTYHLTETGLQAAFSQPLETQIPLALSPQIRFTPGWTQKYGLERLPDGILYQVEGGLMVRIQVSAGQVRAVDSFLEAIPFIAAPENPNLELSRGFFLPFPLTVVHVFASHVSITVRP